MTYQNERITGAPCQCGGRARERSMRVPYYLSILILAATLSSWAQPEAIRVLQDFEGGGRSTGGLPAGIGAASSNETEFGKSCLRVSIAANFGWRWQGWTGKQDSPLESVRLGILTNPYLPPEADAVRLRVRVASGRAILTVGGPVSQLGNSDVFCDPQLVEAAPGQGWQTVEFSLNQRLIRNFRRANFSAELPVVAYSRWIQEPLYLYLVAPPPQLRAAEETVLFVDQAELLAKGEGRPFPQFAPAAVKAVARIADFEAEEDRAKVVSVAHGQALGKSFEEGYRRQGREGPAMPKHTLGGSTFVREEGIPYPAPRYTLVPGAGGGRALQAECMWAEEGQIVTVKNAGSAAGANALSLAAKLDFPGTASGTYSCRVAGQPVNVLDVVVFVAPRGAAFPWRDFEPSDELRQALQQRNYPGPGAVYDYLLTPDARVRCTRVPDIRQAGAFGFYMARRVVPAGEWTTLVVPWADFLCVYGQGECRDNCARQLQLQAETIAAVGFLAPYGTGHGTLRLDNLAWVQVPGAPAELRSYWQPDPAAVRMTALPAYNQYGTWKMMTLGEEVPAFLRRAP